ncbi:MAG: nitrous oxide-stimulated promoter family protein [Bacteroidales bacterium]|nr:nitrous oxide-stimulated promoter family protein [Bacteroidales bacterium]
MNDKEKKTVSRMIRIYCRKKHKRKYDLCPECKELQEYAHKRLEHCPFKENKPNCKNCTIHCYKTIYKDKIKQVMRFSGPRILFYHPLETIRHFIK